MDATTSSTDSGRSRRTTSVCSTRRRSPLQNPRAWKPSCGHSTMAVIYEPTFQCSNCDRFPPSGTLYRCTMDRESLIQDAFDDGYSVAFDSLGSYFEKHMSLGKSGADVRSKPSNSPLTEMSKEQLSSYTPEQLNIIEAQRNNVRDTITKERNIFEHPTPECARYKYPYDARPWVPAANTECQYKVCSLCLKSGHEKTWVSLNSVLNNDIPPNVATGFSFIFARGRPICNANVVRNIGLRPVSLPSCHPAIASQLITPPSTTPHASTTTEANPSNQTGPSLGGTFPLPLRPRGPNRSTSPRSRATPAAVQGTHNLTTDGTSEGSHSFSKLSGADNNSAGAEEAAESGTADAISAHPGLDLLA